MLRNIIQFTFFIFIILINFQAHSNPFFNDNKDPLSNQEAFTLEYEKRKDKHFIIVDIEENYYIYEDKLHISPKTKLNYITDMVNDNFYDQVSVIKESFSIRIEPNNDYNISLQGCSPQHNICYQEQNFDIKYKNGDFTINESLKESDTTDKSKTLIDKAKSAPIYIKLLIFFIIGITISLTPCVLPMIPILTSMIFNSSSNKIKPQAIAFSYVLGSSTLYGFIGAITTLGFFGIQSYIQNNFFIIGSTIILILFALIMLEKINLYKVLPVGKLNSKIDKKLRSINFNLKNSFIIGFLSAMILSPCVAAPLGALLIYTATLSNPFEAFSYLLSFGFGSGLILIVFSKGITNIKPQNFIFIKYIISLFLFIISVFLLSRIVLNDWIIYTLYAASILFTLLFYIEDNQKDKKLSTIGILLFIGFILFGFNQQNNELSNNKNEYSYIESVEDIKNKKGDFIVKIYADWCTYCQDMENTTFKNYNEPYTLHTLDITNINKNKRNVLSEYNAVSAPAIILFKNGEYVKTYNGHLSKNELIDFLNN